MSTMFQMQATKAKTINEIPTVFREIRLNSEKFWKLSKAIATGKNTVLSKEM